MQKFVDMIFTESIENLMEKHENTKKTVHRLIEEYFDELEHNVLIPERRE